MHGPLHPHPLQAPSRVAEVLTGHAGRKGAAGADNPHVHFCDFFLKMIRIFDKSFKSEPGCALRWAALVFVFVACI